MAESDTVKKNSKSSKYAHLQKQKVKYEGNDAWQVNVEKFSKGDMRHKMAEVTTFTEKYPGYMGPLIKKELTQIKNILKEHGIKFEQDEGQGVVSVSTSNDTWDPYSIMNGKTFIALVCRSMPIKLAAKIFEDGTTAEIVKVKGLAADDEVFKKRRRRLMGKDNDTVDMLERMLDVHVKVQGGTVAVLGGYNDVRMVQKVILGIMTGKEFPYHTLKSLQIMKDLQSNPEYKDVSWESLLPKFKSGQATKPKQKKKKKVEKKVYNPFPPEREESHTDKRMTEGLYFLSDAHIKKGHKDGQKKTSEKIQESKRLRKYTAPEEPEYRKQQEGLEPPGVDLPKKTKKRKPVEEDEVEEKPLKKKSKKNKAVEEEVVEEQVENKSKKSKKSKD